MSNKESFEDTLKKLELIVEKLESGSIGLDEMLELFEQGIQLTKSCQKELQDAEDKIKTIVKSNDNFIKKSGIQSS